MSLPARRTPASRGGDGFAGKVAVLIAILATIGTLFGYIGNSSYNEAALLKNSAAIEKTSAANAWNHYQAKSNKQNLAELATNLPGVDHVHYRAEVVRYQQEKDEIRREAERWEASSAAFSTRSDEALHRHRQWSLASVAQQIAISLAAVALLARRTWLLGATVTVAAFGLVIAAFAWLHAEPSPLIALPFAAALGALLLMALLKDLIKGLRR